MVDNGKEIPEDRLNISKEFSKGYKEIPLTRSEIVKELPWDVLEVTKSCGNSTEAKNSLKICGNSKGGGRQKMEMSSIGGGGLV